MPTIIEFLIYQQLTGKLGAIYYCQNEGDKSGNFVSLAEYEALKTSFENLQQQLLIDGHYESCACVQAASVDCSCGARGKRLHFAPPDTIPQQLVIAKLQAMTPEEATRWLGEVYELTTKEQK